ncbi:MAG TPA: tripartite tricarboxylate transporter TctB family protein [Pirellulales bacterium]|nr:tripartite tricarboxylate transporter TctB family protein [Pirellulales bacterium]
MASQRWRDRLFEELHRQGLPSSYVSRLVDELTDHANDLLRENPSMDAEQNADARLGTPEHLAAVARAEFGRRTFAGRHPIWTFLVGPIVAVIGALIGTFATIVAAWYAIAWLVDTATGGSLSAIDANGGPPPSFVTWVADLSYFSYTAIMRFVPFVLSTWIFVYMGRRSGLRWWSMTACGLIAAIAVFFSATVIPQTAHSNGLLMYGFDWRIGTARILQAVVPLAFGAWMLWRSSASRPETLAA